MASARAIHVTALLASPRIVRMSWTFEFRYALTGRGIQNQVLAVLLYRHVQSAPVCSDGNSVGLLVSVFLKDIDAPKFLSSQHSVGADGVFTLLTDEVAIGRRIGAHPTDFAAMHFKRAEVFVIPVDIVNFDRLIPIARYVEMSLPGFRIGSKSRRSTEDPVGQTCACRRKEIAAVHVLRSAFLRSAFRSHRIRWFGGLI